MNPNPLFPLLTVLILSLFPAQPTSTTIPLGSTLYASNLNQTWPSPSNTFYVSFTHSPSSSSLFLPTINYNGGISVWSAGSTPVDSSASFSLLSSGSLRLVNGSGFTIWDSNTSSLNVTSASLNDYGNLVLSNRTGSSVWSSFSNPTDTILPNQTFSVSNTLSSNVYSFNLQKTGNLTLTWNSSITYYDQGLNSSVSASNLTSPTLFIQSTGIFTLSDPSLSGGGIIAYSNDYAEGGSDVLRYVKLDSDGNLRIYSSSLGTGAQTATWAAVSDQCEVYGYCGNLGLCSYNATSQPVCGCPSENFEPLDKNDLRQGCKRTVEIADCTGSLTMLELDHAKFLTYSPELSSQVFFVPTSACRSNCLSNNQGTCFASTLLSDGSGKCYFKTSDYLSGYTNPSLPSTSYLKVCPPVVGNPPPGTGVVGGSSGGIRAWVIVVAILGSVFVLVGFECGLWWWFCRNSPKFGSLSAQYALLEYASGAPVQFSFKELERSTGGFKEKLGEGGFGAVYRGVLANKTVVAVKQLEGIEQGEKHFRMEVATISSTHHLNLVRLIGFCSEGKHRLLVYEFMKNGSLDNFLFNEDGEEFGRFLNWEQRFNIALGTARGITYLHQECRDCIVHCDIKPENILLNENYNAKVSDFGLAKLINPKDHRHRTLRSVRGTRGYLAPEWLANLPITSKSDVYSYGMVLLEIVGGRRNFDVSAETNRKKFSLWAYEEFDKGNVNAIIDKRLLEHHVDMAQVIRAIQVSFWCIHEQPSQRPMMGKVVQMLEGIMEIERPPPPRMVTEGGMSGTSINISSNASALSTFAASAPAPSSSSSYQNLAGSPLTSEGITEKASSSLLQSEVS